MLEMKGWWVKSTHGNIYQSGFPDLFATHRHYGPRWIEVKRPGRRGKRVFEPSQLKAFKEMTENGTGVWVLTGYEEADYMNLFRPYNWTHYLTDELKLELGFEPEPEE